MPREFDRRRIAARVVNAQIAGNTAMAEFAARIHRGQAMRKMQCRSVAERVRKMDAPGIGRACALAWPPSLGEAGPIRTYDGGAAARR
ncbi:hypothetical protein [Burkholderia stabilis]|uniref:hypothetical protein n=1 Tax=Burkholderia stabilis TaxID=95485 RepID=UPI00080B0986|nr:hypothetical protein [Burkholderia stabilis]